MGWQDLLEESACRLVAPWLGDRWVYRSPRFYRVSAPPKEHGWYKWKVSGRWANLVEPAELDPDYGRDYAKVSGYLIGDRMAPDGARVDPDPETLHLQTKAVYLVEEGLDRFSRAEVWYDPENKFVYAQQLFPLGPEDEVRRAFIDRKESVDHIPGVVPALDLAFQLATRQRALVEQRREELRKRREEERRREEARRNMGTGLGRRTMAGIDFEAAARAALSVGGAELLDVRDGRNNEVVVQYRVRHRRLECVADRRTLQIVDSGICLEDHRTREKGDTYFTLESLPGVVCQAIDEGRLVVYRHVDGDEWED